MKPAFFLLFALFVATPLSAEIFEARDLEIARALRAAGLAGDGGFAVVADLTTRVGPRLAGTEADAKAVAWAEERLGAMDFDRVWLEEATYPTWTRNTERVEVRSPVRQEFQALAIGFSPATPAGGIIAEVAMFDDLEALEAVAPEEVDGKIAFIRKRMERARDGSGYGPAVQARSRGAYIAAEKGAAGLIIRSIGTSTNRFAHTGGMRFDDGLHRLPAAAISNPDADQLERLIELGEPVELFMEIDAQVNRPYTGHNVIAEITGADSPEKFVALGAHLDSWDVGTGALDDGAGIAIITEAARLILESGKRPKRSIRIIYFAAEEIGLWGGRAWAEARAEEVENIQVVAESDFGAGRIYELGARVAPEAWPVIEAIFAELEPLGIEMAPGERRYQAFGGPDFIPALPLGVAAVDLRQDGTVYFDYHHTENDTLDKIDPDELAQNAAAYAVFAWLAAQSPVDFGSGPGLLENPAGPGASDPE